MTDGIKLLMHQNLSLLTLHGQNQIAKLEQVLIDANRAMVGITKVRQL